MSLSKTLAVIRETASQYSGHIWLRTNTEPIVRDFSVQDFYRCSICGITGTRTGTSEFVVRDAPYRSVKYRYCRTRERNGRKLRKGRYK